MKMNLSMSFEEGLKVIEALRKCAMDNGWDEDELEDSGVIEEYTAAADAALTALGISVNIAKTPEVEDDDEDKEDDDFDLDDLDDLDDEDDNEDEDEDDEDDDEEEDTCQYSLTPKGQFVLKALEAGIAFEDACNLADFLFDNNEGE